MVPSRTLITLSIQIRLSQVTTILWLKLSVLSPSLEIFMTVATWPIDGDIYLRGLRLIPNRNFS